MTSITNSSPQSASKMVEKQITSDVVYDGKVVKLRIDAVRLPNGRIARREIVRHPGAVAIVPIDAEGKIVMVKQYRYAAGRVLLEIPAGTLELGEPPEVCAIRELQEETSFKPGRIEKIGGIYVAPGYTTEFIHLYRATNLTPSRLEMDDDEQIEVLHLSMEDVLARIKSGEIADGKTISGVLLVKELYS